MNPINPIDPSHAPKTLVLLDPTSPQGESALELLDAEDRHVALVVLTAGPSAAALRQYAGAENIDVSSAADIYLDQVADRVAAPDRIVEVIRVSGSAPTVELADLEAMSPTRRVLRPAPLAVARPESGLTEVRRLIGRWVGAGRAA